MNDKIIKSNEILKNRFVKFVNKNFFKYIKLFLILKQI